VLILPDDLAARAVDAERKSSAGDGRGHIKRSVHAAAKEEAVDAGAVQVIPDDLARGTDVGRDGALCGGRIVDGGIGTAVRIVEEAVRAGHVEVRANDLACVVEAVSGDVAESRWLVEGVEDMDRHDADSLPPDCES